MGRTLNYVKIISDKLNLVKKYSEHKEIIQCIKKIIHPISQECLISQKIDGIIKLWVNDE